MTYAEKLKDPRWQKKRLEVMQRDNFTCRDCDSTQKTLHVHHCAYGGRDPWDAPESVLLTVCAHCHVGRQLLEDSAHIMLGQIMAKMRNAKDDEILGDFVGQLADGTEWDDVSIWPHSVVAHLDRECQISRR